MKTALPRALGRFVRIGPMPDDEGRVVGVDSVVEREVEIVRVPFGRERRAERDAFVARLRERTSVVHPSLRSVLDGGEWDEDAFGALERLRGRTPLEAWRAGADVPARARAAAEILRGAGVLEARGLGLEGEPEIVVDDYGQPKILGLDRAVEGEAAALATLAALVRRGAAVAPDALAERVAGAGTPAAREAVALELERVAASAPSAPFAADLARGEAALAEAGKSRQMLIGLGLIAFFAVLVAAALVILR